MSIKVWNVDVTPSSWKFLTMPNLHGARRCVNPKCNRQLYSDYVKLSSGVVGKVLLCGDCWIMRIDDLPEAEHAVKSYQRVTVGIDVAEEGESETVGVVVYSVEEEGIGRQGSCRGEAHERALPDTRHSSMEGNGEGEEVKHALDVNARLSLAEDVIEASRIFMTRPHDIDWEPWRKYCNALYKYDGSELNKPSLVDEEVI